MDRESDSRRPPPGSDQRTPLSTTQGTGRSGTGVTVRHASSHMLLCLDDAGEKKKKSRTAIGLCAVKIRDTGPVYVRVASPWPLGWRRGGLGAVPLRWRALYGLGMYEWTPQSHACTSSNEMYTCSREGGEIKLSAASHRAEVGFCLRMHLPPSCQRPSGL